MHEYEIVRLDELAKHGDNLKMRINTPLDYFVNVLNDVKAESKKSNPNFQVLKDLCFQLVSRLFYPIQYFDNSFILRSRPNYNGEVFKNVSEISCNPFSSAGRFNLQHEPVFYGAAPIDTKNGNGTLTTICECNKELFNANSQVHNQYYTIGRWQIRKPLQLLLLSFYDKACSQREELKNINRIFSDLMTRMLNEEDNKKCEIVYSYFSGYAGMVHDSDNAYLVTTAFYHAIQEYYGKEVGLLYSSSMTDNTGLNIVLTKDMVDAKYIELDLVVMFKSQRNPSKFKDFTVAKCSDPATADSNGNFALLGIC